MSPRATRDRRNRPWPTWHAEECRVGAGEQCPVCGVVWVRVNGYSIRPLALGPETSE